MPTARTASTPAGTSRSRSIIRSVHPAARRVTTAESPDLGGPSVATSAPPRSGPGCLMSSTPVRRARPRWAALPSLAPRAPHARWPAPASRTGRATSWRALPVGHEGKSRSGSAGAGHGSLARGLLRFGGGAVVDGLLLGGVVAADDVVVAGEEGLDALSRDLGLVVLPAVVTEDGVAHAGVGVEVGVGGAGQERGDGDAVLAQLLTDGLGAGEPEGLGGPVDGLIGGGGGRRGRRHDQEAPLTVV